jgi:hypothetical protein
VVEVATGMSDLESLVDSVRALIEAHGLREEIARERLQQVGLPRFELTRRCGPCTRYLRAGPVSQRAEVLTAYARLMPDDPVVPWDFEMLLGAYEADAAGANVDSRSGGSSEFVLELVRLWLIDVADVKSLPLPNAV